jgi:putative transposase
MGAYKYLTQVGVTTREAAQLTGVPRSSATRAPNPAPVRRARLAPVNKLSDNERTHVVDTLNSDQFVDKPPLQVFAHLLGQGTYLCSPRTMYRVLHENKQVKERRRLATHPARAIPELVATRPGEVYTWDITKLAGPIKGTWYDAYVMIDIFSRYIIGAIVHTIETAILAEEMMREVFNIHGTPKIVHADRGTSMTSKTVAALLANLEVTRSHSRPRVSNDNPYSEAWFKTLKYAPTFPDRFGSLTDARQFMASFVHWYNHEHHHTGIGLHTPAEVHYNLTEQTRTTRTTTLAAARARNPERFTTTGEPKILATPQAAWINQPTSQQTDQPLFIAL